MNQPKNIQELVPPFAEDYIDIENSIFDKSLYHEFIAKNRERIGLLGKYINGKSHDSWVLSSKLSNETFQLQLNDFTTRVFSEALIAKKELNYAVEELIFPIEMNFQNVIKFQCYEIDEKGFALPIQLSSIDEYLDEYILDISKNSIEIAFQFWKNAESEIKPGQRLVMIICCETIEVKEYQDEAWNSIFGNTYDEYYEYFKKHLESERYASNYSDFLKLIEEYEGENKNPFA